MHVLSKCLQEWTLLCLYHALSLLRTYLYIINYKIYIFSYFIENIYFTQYRVQYSKQQYNFDSSICKITWKSFTLLRTVLHFKDKKNWVLPVLMSNPGRRILTLKDYDYLDFRNTVYDKDYSDFQVRGQQGVYANGV